MGNNVRPSWLGRHAAAARSEYLDAYRFLSRYSGAYKEFGKTVGLLILVASLYLGIDGVEGRKILENIPEEELRRAGIEDPDYSHALKSFVGLMSVAVVVFLGVTGFWRWYVFWKPPPFKSIWRVVWNTVFAWLLLTAWFAVAAELLLHLGEASLSAGTDPDLIKDHGSLAAFWENLVWHLSDTIPILQVPETLHWKPSVIFSGTSIGILFLAYKVGVALPILSAFYQLKNRNKQVEVAPVCLTP